jgi:site-specific DNA recombinase
VAGQPAPAADAVLTRTQARAHGWLAEMKAGLPLATLARKEGCAESYQRTRLPLAFLSPRLQAALLEGTQPPELSLERLGRSGIPLDWAEQEQRFGFAD